MYKCIWWFALLFFLTSCARNDYSTVLISDCELPCWQGITPGKTNIHDAKDLLAGLDSVEITRESEYPDSVVIGAAFENGIDVELFAESDEVMKIWLSKENIWRSSYKYPPIRLGDALKSTGLPDGFFIGSLSGGRHAHAFLLFDDLYMVLSVEITSTNVGNSVLYTLTEDDSVMIINFFAPEIFEEELQVMKEEYGWPLPVIEFSWKGYGDY